jgi:uncharacterized glyoxalase superfamily protein PhnB
MDVADFVDAIGSDEDVESGSAASADVQAPDAAATPDAAGPDLFSLLLEGDPPAHDAAPDANAEDDPYAAESDDDAEEPETAEERIARLEAENAEFLQAKRNAEAQAEESHSRAYWQSKETEVDDRLRQAVAHLDYRLKDSPFDANAVIAEYLPRLIAGYTADLKELSDEKLQAVWAVAKKHGSITYKQNLQERLGLTESDIQRISKYPPEMWEAVAADLAEIRERDVAPVRRELTSTKGQLTKAQRAVRRDHLAAMPTPGAGRATVRDFAQLKGRITQDNADAVIGPLLTAMGVGV